MSASDIPSGDARKLQDKLDRELKQNPLAATPEIELLAGLALDPDTFIRDPLVDLLARLNRETDHAATLACMGVESEGRDEDVLRMLADHLTDLHRVAEAAVELLRRERKATSEVKK